MFKQVKEDIASVFSRDPAARNTLEVLLNYPGLHAVLFHRLAHHLTQIKHKGFTLQPPLLVNFFIWIGSPLLVHQVDDIVAGYLLVIDR